jgi:SWIM/SEC-C metal-binding protein
MSKLGTKKRPAVVRVCTEERAQEVLAMATDAGVKVIIGIEPDKSEDITDLTKAMKNARPPSQVARPSKNAPCPCGSGRKYKGCCGKTG